MRIFLCLLTFIAFLFPAKATPLSLLKETAACATPLYPTAQEYCDFLNEVAVTDPQGLYDAKMEEASITRLGTPGSYYYTQASQNTSPHFISVMNALAYCAWDKRATWSLSIQNQVDLELKASTPQIVWIVRNTEEKASRSAMNHLWDMLHIILGAGITVGTLFAEGHFSLEAARREAPVTPRESSSSPHEIKFCYSSKSIQESLVPPEALSRLHTDAEALETLHGSDVEALTHYHQAIALEKKLAAISQRTFTWDILQSLGHIGSGFGRLTNLGFHVASPLLDNSRRVVAGSIIGYGIGALVSHLSGGDFFSIMSNGSLGTLFGALPMFAYNIHDTYQNWGDFSTALATRHEEMCASFSAAKKAYCGAWRIAQEHREAFEERRAFYEKLLHEHGDKTAHPEWKALLLEAEAHHALTSSPEEFSESLKAFLEKGSTFYNPAIMEYACPPALQENLSPEIFARQKDAILARVRGAHIAYQEHYKKNYPQGNDPSPFFPFQSLASYTKDLKDYERNQFEDLKGEQRSLCTALGKFSYETTLLAGNIVLMSSLGFFAGSFIGAVIPLSLSFENVYIPLVEMNSTAVAYSAYFLCVDLSNSQNRIRQSARKTAEAFVDVYDAWNHTYEIQRAEEKYTLASTVYESAREREIKERNLLVDQEREYRKKHPGSWDLASSIYPPKEEPIRSLPLTPKKCEQQSEDYLDDPLEILRQREQEEKEKGAGTIPGYSADSSHRSSLLRNSTMYRSPVHKMPPPKKEPSLPPAKNGVEKESLLPEQLPAIELEALPEVHTPAEKNHNASE